MIPKNIKRCLLRVYSIEFPLRLQVLLASIIILALVDVSALFGIAAARIQRKNQSSIRIDVDRSDVFRIIVFTTFHYGLDLNGKRIYIYVYIL